MIIIVIIVLLLERILKTKKSLLYLGGYVSIGSSVKKASFISMTVESLPMFSLILFRLSFDFKCVCVCVCTCACVCVCVCVMYVKFKILHILGYHLRHILLQLFVLSVTAFVRYHLNTNLLKYFEWVS